MIQTCEHGSVVIVVLPPFVFLLLDSGIHRRGLAPLEWGTSNLYIQSDQITTIITTMFRNGKIRRGQGGKEGVTLRTAKRSLKERRRRRGISLPAESLVKVSYAISGRVGLEGRGDSIRCLHPERTSRAQLETVDS